MSLARLFFAIVAWASLVSAFYPWVPDYRCVDEGTCPATKRAENANGENHGVGSIKLVQRLPVVSFESLSRSYIANITRSRMMPPMSSG